MNFKHYTKVINQIVDMKQHGVGSRTIGKQLNLGKVPLTIIINSGWNRII